VTVECVDAETQTYRLTRESEAVDFTHTPPESLLYLPGTPERENLAFRIVEALSPDICTAQALDLGSLVYQLMCELRAAKQEITVLLKAWESVSVALGHPYRDTVDKTVTDLAELTVRRIQMLDEVDVYSR
jgi:hypothetical protein